MARRKRKDDAPDWVPPEFDEVEYMRKEVDAGRASVVTVVWAIVGAAVSFLIFSASPAFWPLAFFGGLGVASGLYVVFPLFRVKVAAFKRRDWTGHGVTYFFSWLAFWIILLNAPFGDFTNPTIDSMTVSPYRAGLIGGLDCVPVAPGGIAMVTSDGLNDSVHILFRAADNVGIANIGVRIAPSTSSAYTVNATPVTSNPCRGSPSLLSGTYEAVAPFAGSFMDMDITATDLSGRATSVRFRVTFS